MSALTGKGRRLDMFEQIANYTFLQYAILAGLLASITCGIIGTYVVVRRNTYIAATIAHCILGGMGVARYLQKVYGLEWCTPLLGAVVAAVFAAFAIGVVTLYWKQRQDTVLSVVWALGMAIGITFITKTPGYNEDLMSYLFGNILMVSKSDLWFMAGLNVTIIVVVLLFYKKFLVICFNEELARLRGISVDVYYFLLLLLTALAVVLLVQVVGIILVIALLALPAAIAGHLVGRMWQMMIVAMLLCALFTLGGIAISYTPELPAGATIIELAGGTYLAVLAIKRISKALLARKIR